MTTTTVPHNRPRVLPTHGAPPGWRRDSELGNVLSGLEFIAAREELLAAFSSVNISTDVERGPTLPDRSSIGRLRHGELRVVRPITVHFSVEDGQNVAEAPDFNEVGYGNTRSEALADLQFAIAELYFGLEGEQGNLGSDLASLWSQLNQAIEHLEYQEA